MRINEIVNYLETFGDKHNMISSRRFNRLFTLIPASRDGNCLFHAVSQLQDNYNFDELRRLVCNYYKTFNKNGRYKPDSLKDILKIQFISDNNEANGTLHEDNICRNGQYAGIMDVIALADILKINIVVLSHLSDRKVPKDLDNPHGRKKIIKGGYTVHPFIYSDNADTIFIKYNGTDHFDSLFPNFIQSPIFEYSPIGNSSSSLSDSGHRPRHVNKSNKTSSSPKTKKLPKNSPSNSIFIPKSASSETIRLLNNIPSDSIFIPKSASSETMRQINNDMRRNYLEEMPDVSPKTMRKIMNVK